MLNNFLKYKNLKHNFQPIGNYYKNICWLNDTRRAVTKGCCNKYVENKRSCEINFKYKSHVEKYKVCIGMPVIAIQNMKKRDMFNMMEFTIDDILNGRQVFNDSSDEDDTPYVYNEGGLKQLRFVVNNEEFDYNEFRESFFPNFCNTVYKYQGGKIDEHYNIWDTHKMDVKEMYTSLSRTTKLEYIHLDNKKKCRWYREREQDQMIILNSYFNADYQNGKIYHVKLEKNDKHYIGSHVNY